MKLGFRRKLIGGVLTLLMAVSLHSAYATSQAPGQSGDRGSSTIKRQQGAQKSVKPTSPSQAVRRGQNVTTPSPKPKNRGCQQREQSIQKRSGQLLRLATNMLEVFERIAERVKTYYLTVVVPNGQSLEQYNELLASIDQRKTEVEDALEVAANTASSFDCTDSNPKQQLQEFRQDMQNVKRSLKLYRTAIKDLIVGVRSITGKSSGTASPTPSASPTATVTTTPAPSITP